MEQREKIKCPYCGYHMPVEISPNAVVHGVWVKCKGRNCRRIFEIRFPEQKKDTK